MTDFSTRWVNLTSAGLGATALDCSDDFFAPMHRMLADAPPIFIDDKYDDHGKWMDGWESRRKRGPGHDWCIVKLARPGMIHGIEINTQFFTGNYAPGASMEGCFYEGEDDALANDESVEWLPILDQSALGGDQNHVFSVENTHTFTHIKLHIYPDGGIARLKVYGEPKVDWQAIAPGTLTDIAASLNGGVALACNNEHYGRMQNLLTPGRGVNMGDGWETRRRREPGHDWVIIALAHPGVVSKIDIDTAHFKGNYPDRCAIFAANLNDNPDLEQIESLSESWGELLPESKLEADTEHTFTNINQSIGPVTHVRVNIYPDGGISRIRIFADVHADL